MRKISKYIIILSAFFLVFSGVFIFWKPLPAQAKGYIKVISSNGGEQWELDKTYEIKWESSGIEKVGIVLYKSKTIIGVIARNVSAKISKILWIPRNLEEGEDYRIAVYEYPWLADKPVDYSDNSFAIKKSISSLSSVLSQYYTLGASHITPEEIFHFNPKKNSGWFYIAQTVPESGIAFWVAAVRSLSTNPTDTSAQLLYGITNTNTGEHYSGFLDGGSFSESSDKVNLFYKKDGKKILEFWQTKTDLSEFELKINLPWNGTSLQTTKTLTLSRPILYESGDGIIPMAPGIDSLYASMVTDQGFWIDFQKFNVDSNASFFQTKLEANHRWGSFILNKSVDTPMGTIPAGTAGVAWEILDKNNQRQPGGYTNVDLLIPGFPQFTAKDAQIEMGKIEVIETWNSGHKTYLKKWKMSYPGGIELLFETVMPNQENGIMGHYFYEGMIKVINPQTGEVVGTGMLEQTHNEATDNPVTTWTDSDGGKNYNVKGYVKDQSGNTKDDYCTASGQLHEFYCENGAVKEIDYTCPSGYTCQDGACKSSSQFSVKISDEFLVTGDNIAVIKWTHSGSEPRFDHYWIGYECYGGADKIGAVPETTIGTKNSIDDSSINWPLPVPLPNASLYNCHIKIRVLDKNGKIIGPTYERQFADGEIRGPSLMKVKILKPSDKETLQGGSTYTVQWSYTNGDPRFDDYRIEYECVYGNLHGIIGHAHPINETSISWQVPLPSSDQGGCQIIVYTFGWGVRGIGVPAARNEFNIKGKNPSHISNITVVTPRQTDIVIGGHTVSITWTHTGADLNFDHYWVGYQCEGVDKTLIGKDSSMNSAFMDWQVPLVSSDKTNCQVIVYAMDAKENPISNPGLSAKFTIQASSEKMSVEILRPTESDFKAACMLLPIQWTHTGTDPRFKSYTIGVQCDKDGWTQGISHIERQDTHYNFWYIPLSWLDKTGCQIKVFASDFSSPSSNFNFDSEFKEHSISNLAVSPKFAIEDFYGVKFGGSKEKTVIQSGIVFPLTWVVGSWLSGTKLKEDFDHYWIGYGCNEVPETTIATKTPYYATPSVDWHVPIPPTGTNFHKCYLKVAAINKNGGVMGCSDIWNFGTIRGPSDMRVQILHPEKGETLQGGSPYTIQWNHTNSDPRFSHYVISSGGFPQAGVIGATDSIYDTSFTWQVPLLDYDTSGCYVRVEASGEEHWSGTKYHYYENISVPPSYIWVNMRGAKRSHITNIRVVGFSDNSPFYAGKTYPIVWVHEGTDLEHFDHWWVGYKCDEDVDYLFIGKNNSVDGLSIDWPIPSTAPDKHNCKIKVYTADANGNPISEPGTSPTFRIIAK